jgi:Rrf2 family protein
MKLSTKARYGLRAITEIAKTYGDVPAKRKDIAEKQGISDSYLENLLIVLKNIRLVETTRGSNGGYVLCRPPSKITVLEIVEALDGPLDLVDCISDEKNCEKSKKCSARVVWEEMSRLLRQNLGQKTIQDLLDIENAAQCPDYSI